MKYFIANWKANKNLYECANWLKVFIKGLKSIKLQNKVIICPPYPLVYFTKKTLENANIKSVSIGAQDISFFEQGKYTGEVTAAILHGLVDYAIIGHSERRKYFNESIEILNTKINLAKKYGIEPIYCIRGLNDQIPNDIKIVVYEPVDAIGTGNNEDVAKVLDLKKKLTLKQPMKFFYGGSVNQDNITDYLKTSEIDGFLVGTMSLDSHIFLGIITKA